MAAFLFPVFSFFPPLEKVFFPQITSFCGFYFISEIYFSISSLFVKFSVELLKGGASVFCGLRGSPFSIWSVYLGVERNLPRPEIENNGLNSDEYANL